jgi:hypothetical protein
LTLGQSFCARAAVRWSALIERGASQPAAFPARAVAPAAEGHGYLGLLAPWIAAVLALALGGFLTRLARAWRGTDRQEGAVASTRALWIVCSAALLGIHVVQEFLELLLIPGNTGLYAMLGAGMVWAAIAALAVGGVLALALRGARALIVRAGRRRRPGPRRPAVSSRLSPLAASAACYWRRSPARPRAARPRRPPPRRHAGPHTPRRLAGAGSWATRGGEGRFG